MKRRDFLPNGLIATTLGVTLASRASAQETCVAPCYERTQREIDEDIVPVDYQYPPGNVLRYGANPGGGGNASTAISNAIRALPQKGGVVEFPAGLYNCVDPINCDGKWAITLKGQGGSTSGVDGTRLQYTGIGASFISLRSATGCKVEDLQIIHTSSAFTGYLLDFSHSSSGSDSALNEVSHCLIGGPGGVTTAYGINLDKAIEFTARANNFAYLKSAILGQSGLGGSYSNAIRIIENQFIAQLQNPIAYGGQAWQIHGNTFESLTNGTAGAFGSSPSTPNYGLSFQNNWFGDATNPGGLWIVVFGGGFVFKGNYCGGNSGTYAISLNNVDGADISGNSFESFATAISFDTPICKNISVGQNNYRLVTSIYGSENNQSSFRSNQNGFASLPNGLLMQWGRVSISAGTTAPVTFPRSFGAVYSVVTSLVGPSTPTNVAYANGVSTSGMTVGIAGTAGTSTLHWIATGAQ